MNNFTKYVHKLNDINTLRGLSFTEALYTGKIHLRCKLPRIGGYFYVNIKEDNIYELTGLMEDELLSKMWEASDNDAFE